MTIPLLVKRRKKDKSNAYEDAICPQRVTNALRYLFVENVLSAMHNANPEIDPNVGAPNTRTPNEESDDDQSDVDSVDDNDLSDDDLEDDTPAGNLDTLINQYESPELNEKIIIAPGEGRIPQGILDEKYAEELSFPCIFAGIPKLALENRITKFTKN